MIYLCGCRMHFYCGRMILKIKLIWIRINPTFLNGSSPCKHIWTLSHSTLTGKAVEGIDFLLGWGEYFKPLLKDLGSLWIQVTSFHSFSSSFMYSSFHSISSVLAVPPPLWLRLFFLFWHHQPPMFFRQLCLSTLKGAFISRPDYYERESVCNELGIRGSDARRKAFDSTLSRMVVKGETFHMWGPYSC